jgi:hypothetical protein
MAKGRLGGFCRAQAEAVRALAPTQRGAMVHCAKLRRTRPFGNFPPILIRSVKSPFECATGIAMALIR